MFSNASHFVIGNGSFYSVTERKCGGFELLQKLACMSATHDSSSRYPPPKCDPETRQDLVAHLVDWLNSSSTSQCKLLWLNGAAGAGKSAVAQTFSEYSEKEGSLLATFFFSRNVDGRKDHTTLVATLAYQISVRIPEAKSYIAEVLENDPAIFEKSLVVQMNALIVRPLNAVASSEDVASVARLIIIDGLDECEQSPIQDQIVEAAGYTTRSCGIPLCFLIASRRHYHIEDVFGRAEFINATHCVSLDQWDTCDRDLEIYMRNEFEKIRQRFPHNPTLRQAKQGTWPSDHFMRLLLRKASGQFIYAKTVLGFIEDRHYNPVERLKSIVLGSPSTLSPFGELDALYTEILRSVPDDSIMTTMKILGILFEIGERRPSLIEDILGLNPGDVAMALCDLTPVLSISPPEDNNESVIYVHHASFQEFLFNMGNDNRNSYFPLKVDQVRTEITIGCLRIMGAANEDDILKAHSPNLRFAIRHWPQFCMTSTRCPELYQNLVQTKVNTWLTTTGVNYSLLPSVNPVELVEGVMDWILKHEDTSNQAVTMDLYEKFRHEMDIYILSILTTCPDRNDLLMVLSLLVAHANLIPRKYIQDLLSISKETARRTIDHLHPFITTAKSRYIMKIYSSQFLSFLKDESRSRQFFLSDEVYNQLRLRIAQFLLKAVDSEDPGYNRKCLKVAEDILLKLHSHELNASKSNTDERT